MAAPGARIGPGGRRPGSDPMKQTVVHPVDRHVGERLRLRRALMGMSQERLAELVGVTFQQIQKYERGLNRIGASRLVEIARILEVPVTWFFEGVDTPDATDGTPGFAGLAEPSAAFVHDAGTTPAPAPRFDRRETLELVRAFNRIPDPLVRRRLFELAKALAALEYRS